MQHITACIIGGGFAGLAAAVFLDSLGIKVTLFERRPILGGRAYAFKDKITGYWVDNGQHLLIGAYHETLKLMEMIGATRHLSSQSKMEVPLISTDKQRDLFSLPPLPVPLNMLIGFLRMKIFSAKDKWNFLKIGRELTRLKKGSPSVSLDQSVDSWLAKLGQSENTRKNFWDLLTFATLNDDPKEATARMLSVVLTKGFFGSRKDGQLLLPKSNLNDLLANPARTYLEMRGHKIKTATGVQKIHILDDKVQGVETDSGEMVKADYYFSSVPPYHLLNLIPDGFVESIPYFENLKKLKSSPILSINLWFDKDIMPYDFVGVAGTQIHWYFNKNRIYDRTHPPFHYMGVTSGAYSMEDKLKDEIVKIALSEFHELFPESRKANLIHSLVNKEREATLSPQVGSEKYRPSQKSPFSNFYVLGDWTNTGYPATIESAVLSARIAVDDIAKLYQ